MPRQTVGIWAEENPARGRSMVYNENDMRMARPLLCVILIGLLGSCGGTKEPTPVTPRSAATDLTSVRPEVGFSGRIVFQSDLDGDNEIYVLTADGLAQLTDNSWDDRYPRWSPDGRRIAFSANARGTFDLFVMGADGGPPEAVTNFPEDELEVTWSPDGSSLAFTRDAGRTSGGGEAIWSIDLGSRRAAETIPGFGRANGLPDISPVSRDIAFTGKRRLGGWDVFLYDPRDQRVRDLTKGGVACRARFSPDGRRMAYVSSEADGKGDIWVMEADGSAKERITARDDTYDYFPSWSPDGTQIVFGSNARDKYADRGDWALYLVNLSDRRVARLLDTPGRDVFPDWR